MPLHPDFKTAAWRGTTNTDGQVIGISFDCAAGETLRFALDLDSAGQLAESILEFLEPYRRGTNRHAEMSAGRSNCDGSPQEGQSV